MATVVACCSIKPAAVGGRSERPGVEGIDLILDASVARRWKGSGLAIAVGRLFPVDLRCAELRNRGFAWESSRRSQPTDTRVDTRRERPRYDGRGEGQDLIRRLGGEWLAVQGDQREPSTV